MQKYLEERGTEPGAHQEEGNKLVPARERRGGLGGRGTTDGDRELGAEDAGGAQLAGQQEGGASGWRRGCVGD
jgi:hypothetical protein